MYKDGITPEDYVQKYEQSIKNIIGADGQLDLILLGMDDDGHTALLFPGEDVLQEIDKQVAA